MFKRGALCAVVCCVMVILVSLPALTQTTAGAIEGVVTDPSGAVVPGVALKVTNVNTGAVVEAGSNDAGLYRFPVLPVGAYDLTANKAGFATITQKGIVVTVGGRVNLPLSLALAAQKENVVVTGEAPIIETTRSQVSSTVDQRSVTDLPTNGRNFINFVLLTPGVTLDNRGGDISFAGQRGTLNSLTVDGTDDNNTFFGQTVGRTGSGRAPYQFSQDAVQEFQVNTNGYSAELGHAGGAVINVVTKSGSNNFHGTGFWYYRDRAMNATDPINRLFGRPKDPYHFNQFGGDIGGPIKKDKAFFFFDYDGQRNTLPNVVILKLPTIAAPDAFQQQAIAYLQARAASWNRTQNQNTYLGKVDWIITSRNQLSARWNTQRFTGGGFENGGTTNAFEHTGASLVQTDTLTGSLTSTLSNSLVNVVRGAYVRDKEPGLANSINPEATVFDSGQLLLTVGRNFFSPRETTIKRGQWSDTMSWVHGKHSVKFGADFIMDRILNFFPGNFSGQYVFRSLESFGRNLAGTPQPIAGETYAQAFAGTGTTGATTHPNIFEAAGFAQDEWRVAPSLSLNFGLRYDLQQMAQPTTKNPAASLAAAGIDTSKIHNSHADFAPRVGFAWTPMGNNRLVVRGGYGLFWGRTPSILVGTAHSNNGINVQTQTFTGAAIPQYPNTLCGAPVNTPSCSAPTGGTSSPPIIFVFDPKYHQPYVEQYSAGVEYQLANNLSLGISYLGVHGVHLSRTRDINLQGPTTPTTYGIAGTSNTVVVQKYTAPRPIAGFSRIEQFEGAASSTYNGLALQLRKRFSQNFQFQAAYTLGKVTDDAPDATAVVPFSFDDAKMVQDPLHPSADRGPGVNDQRHRFVLSGIWQLNYVNGLSPTARAVLGGWELSGILTAQSGQPYTALVSADLNGDGNSRTDRAPGFGRDTFYGPSTVSFDPRITRRVALGERANLQLIWEAFNVFNRKNIASVRNTFYATSSTASVCGVAVSPCLVPQSTGLTAFGMPSTSSGPRIMQLAIKLSF